MRKVKLYIANSLDGYIARADGGLDWLMKYDDIAETDHGYTEFYQTLDTTIMGRKTYEDVLSYDVEWYYKDCTTYIVSSQSTVDIKTPNTKLIDGQIFEKVRAMKQEAGKDIWLIGGGALITAFLQEKLIDEMILSVVPIILGDGIPLFPGVPLETDFEFIKAIPYPTGIVNLHYQTKVD